MPTPSLFPYLLKAAAGGASGVVYIVTVGIEVLETVNIVVVELVPDVEVVERVDVDVVEDAIEVEIPC